MTSYTFAQAAACDALARAAYDSWWQFYGYKVPAFDSLGITSKHLWIHRALELIEVVGELRSQKIVGRISEAEPWGTPVNQAG